MKARAAAKAPPGALVAAGMLVFATMTLILAGISEGVIGRQPLTDADVQFSSWLHANRSPLVTDAMRVATSFGSPVTVTCIAVVLAVYLQWRQRRPYWAAALVLAIKAGDRKRTERARRNLRRLGYRLDVLEDTRKGAARGK